MTIGKPTLSELKQRVVEVVDHMRSEIIAVSDALFENPEVAFEERLSSARLVEWLRSNGFEVATGLANLPTSFKASYRSTTPGPSIALLAEYDALPGLGHACGHNIIAAASVGAAIAVRRVMPDVPGRIVAIGTPAEEYGGGKITMVEAGVFSDVDAAMIVHPNTTTSVCINALANDTIEVEFLGEAAHAAAFPHHGINALDAMVLSYVNISALRQQMRPDARVHGIITKGGEASNIIPAHTEGRFQVRASDDAYLDVLIEKVVACFRAGAEATGARFEYRHLERRYKSMLNNQAMASAFSANLAELGVELDAPDASHSSGSTDMGNVSQAVPSIHPSIAIADRACTLHSPAFARAVQSESGRRGLIVAAKALATTAVDLLMDDDLMVRVRKEFADRV